VTLARYYRDETTLPTLNVLVIARGDSEPIVPNSGGGDHTRNRRVEITVTPLPVPFHAPDSDKPNTAATDAPDSTAPTTTDTPAPVKKDKPKDKKPDIKPDPSPSTTRH
jgi:hypothetical protein